MDPTLIPSVSPKRGRTITINLKILLKRGQKEPLEKPIEKELVIVDYGITK